MYLLSFETHTLLGLTWQQNALRILQRQRRQRRPQRAAPTDVRRTTNDPPNEIPDLRGAPSIIGMSEWLHALGHSVRQSGTRRSKDHN